ncbi:MAG: GPR1/FUN34/YaaH family transporter [Desulforegulaceae bacterium]|nr:GPR1/FUN34/YaaH family transporter [Desulforegulaceae bacterium]
MTEIKHSFATPAPAGLGALVVACFGFGAVFLGKIELAGLPLLAAWLFGGGIVQFTVAVIELKDHNVTGGNVFLFFCAFFMFAACFSTLAKFFMIKSGITPHVVIEGWCWMAGALFLTVVTPAYLKTSLLLFIVVILLDIALWLIFLLDMGVASTGVKPIIGWVLITAGFIALYIIGAVTNNTVFNRTVLPLPGPIVK